MNEIQSTLQNEIKDSQFIQSHNSIPKPWWNPTVEKLCKLKVAAQKSFDIHKNKHNANTLHNAIANFQNDIKSAKKISFNMRI